VKVPSEWVIWRDSSIVASFRFRVVDNPQSEVSANVNSRSIVSYELLVSKCLVNMKSQVKSEY